MVTIRTTLRGAPPRLFIDVPRVAHAVLGPHCSVAVIFIGDALSERLNRTYRNKGVPTNVLAFPGGPASGDIFINVPRARDEHRQFGRTFPEHLARLLIHALLHLKGSRHGSKMDMEEERIYRRFSR